MKNKITRLPFLVPAVFILLSCSSEKRAETPPDRPRTAQVVSMEEEGIVRVLGNIKADKNSLLGFLSDGKIKGIYVRQGDWVEKGTVLAELETARDEFVIQQKQDELEQEKFSGSPRKASVLHQEMLALEEDLDKKKIIAPFSGRVGDINAVEGENYNYGYGSSDKGLIRVINRDRMKALVDIPERDIPRVRKGQTVRFRFDAIPEEFFNGYVSSLSPAGKVVNGYAQMETELVIENPDSRIYPGYSFTAEIFVSESRNILVLDRNAVEWKDDRILVTLSNEDGDILEEREIQVEILDRNRLRILSGLKEGDLVILPSLEESSDTMEMYL